MNNKSLLINFNLFYAQGVKNAAPINLQHNVHYRAAGWAIQASIVTQKISFSSELLSLG